MTHKCDSCGQEVSDVLVKKPSILEFWKKERKTCKRCTYNNAFGTKWNAEEFKKIVREVAEG